MNSSACAEAIAYNVTVVAKLRAPCGHRGRLLRMKKWGTLNSASRRTERAERAFLQMYL